MEATTTPTPKVFISYCHTSEDHMDWVVDLATKLMADSVDVELDQWSLRDGHDMNHFMERMVTDPSITRVIIVSDRRYKEKADAREGGVGTESQIISQEVYARVDQEKFVAIFTEYNDDGTPSLPLFLKGRKGFNFTEREDPDAYDQLIRNIHQRPRRSKPPLGKPPAHLFQDDPVRLASVQKSNRFIEAASNGRGNPALAFDSFLDEFVTDLESLRMTYSQSKATTWCQDLTENIEGARAHRDVFVRTVRAGISMGSEDWFTGQFIPFLEQLISFLERPEEAETFYKHSEDNFKFIVYELYLYTVALLIKRRKFNLVDLLFDHVYVGPIHRNSSRVGSFDFTIFNTSAMSLEEECSRRGGAKRVSVMADLLRERATTNEVRFSELIQAEVICFLRASKQFKYGGWYPRSLIYANSVERLELFTRAESQSGFQPFKPLLGIGSAEELLDLLNSQPVIGTLNRPPFWPAVQVHSLFNLQNLCTKK